MMEAYFTSQLFQRSINTCIAELGVKFQHYEFFLMQILSTVSHIMFLDNFQISHINNCNAVEDVKRTSNCECGRL